MQQLLIYSLIISLKITAIHVVMSEGMMLSPVRVFFANLFDKAFGIKASRIIQEPLWECMICMASFWTITWYIVDTFFMMDLPPFEMTVLIELIFIVCGINIILRAVLDKLMDDGPAY